MKNIDFKKTQWQFSELIIPTTKNLKMERTSKIIYRNERLFRKAVGWEI